MKTLQIEFRGFPSVGQSPFCTRFHTRSLLYRHHGLPSMALQRKVAAKVVEGEELDFEIDIEAAAEKFMTKQAELESGDTSVPKLEQAVGVDIVPDEIARKYCKDIVQAMKDLESFREMSFGEIKLTVAIDPKNREQGPIGAEKESEVSRAELANALSEVVSGQIPNDRIALKVLWEEITTWPGLEIDREQQKSSNKDIDQKTGWRDGQARPPIGRDKSETPVSFEDMLPDWVGYSYLYLISAVPLLIVIVVVAILFVNSLQ